MRSIVLTFLFLGFISTSVIAQSSKEDRNGNLIGFLNKKDFLQGKYNNWFEEGYNEYQPKKSVIKKLSRELEGIDIKAFFGTWCHDSHRELPRFFKTMELAGLDLQVHFEMIGLTRGKKTPDDLQKGFDIKNTPTFIVYKDGKEIGRYVEHSRQSIEKDFLKIIKGKPYKHVYQK
jgi:thiol-disulfide isomerase/thioredoxin